MFRVALGRTVPAPAPARILDEVLVAVNWTTRVSPEVNDCRKFRVEGFIEVEPKRLILILVAN